MVELNRLFRTETNNEQYFTLWYGVYEASTRMLRYAVAGHPPALVLNGGQRGAADAKSLGGTAMPIGMFPDSEFSADSYQVSPGDQVLLWSDGVLGDRLSFAGFMELCQDVACAPNWTLTAWKLRAPSVILVGPRTVGPRTLTPTPISILTRPSPCSITALLRTI